MKTFSEGKQATYILFVIVLLFPHVLKASVQFIDCIKENECSCKTLGKPPQEVSLWQINPDYMINPKLPSPWLYAVDLCHGIKKKKLVKNGRCRDSTVCQYSTTDKTDIFSVGQLGKGFFSLYNIQNKSINLHYIGIRQNGTTRSIDITLQCDESGNATQAEYTDFDVSMFNKSKFVGKIKTKAACLRPVQANYTPSVTPGPKSSTYFKTTTMFTSKSLTPLTTLTHATTPLSQISSKKSGISTSSQHVITKSKLITRFTTPLSISRTSVAISASLTPKSSRLMPTSLTSASTSPTPTSGGLRSKKGLKTVYIVLIVVAGCIIVVILTVYAAYKLFRRRRRSLLDGEDDSDNEFGQSTIETRPI